MLLASMLDQDLAVLSRVIIRGKKYHSGAWYLSLPTRFVRRFGIVNKRFRIEVNKDIRYIEDENGIEVKNYGNKKYAAYYILFPKKLRNRTPVMIVVENKKPLIFRVIPLLPTEE